MMQFVKKAVIWSMKSFAAPSLILTSTSRSEHQQFALKESPISVPGES